jgi:flavin-dependent dehydrogenase
LSRHVRPAGSTPAGLVAAWAHSVVLVHGESDLPSLAESLPASTKKLLRFLGQLDVVEAASFHPNHGNISRWAEQDAVAATTAAGYHVSRAVFDAVLRDHARAQGARLLQASVRAVDLSMPSVVECVGANGAVRCTGRLVLDCSGRAGVIARRGLRRIEAGYRTLAVAGEWRTDDWSVDERTHTVVDSYTNGWAWSVPLSPTRRQCTVMIDADRTTVRKTNLESLYADELARARSISSRLAGATRTGQMRACDASLYDCVKASDGDALLVGDAASFVEPLSSGGVKKALSSAWTASVVVNTCLTKPAMRSAALAFFDRRERQVYGEYLRRSAEFFRQAAAVYDDPFWTARANVTSVAGADSGPSDYDLEHDAEVRRAFEQLRDAARLNLVPSPRLHFADTAVIEGREVVLRDGVVVPGFTEPIRFAAGVNLSDLARMAPNCPDVPSLITAYERRVASADPRNLLLGLSFLLGRGVLSR